MPRQIVHAKEHDRERSLGWLCVAWMEFFVRHGPGDVQGMAIVHGDEYTAFVVDCYALDVDGRRLYDSAFISRPKGCDKSGLGARLALFEGFGPCRIMRGTFGEPVFAKGGEVYRDPWGLGFEYVYTEGEPMGRPVQTPYIRCMATEEGQTGNVFDTIHYNLTDDDCPLKKAMARPDDAGKSRILLPGGGEITPSTASSSAKDGGKETFAVFDEALDIATPVPTPTGWTTIGELVAGDLVYGADGSPTKVIKATETQEDRTCYRLTFRDGSSIIASDGHLWQTRIAGSAAKPKIRTTGQMVADGRRMAVPAPAAQERAKRAFDIDPYILGSWLGDGDKSNATITAADGDISELSSLIESRGYTVKRCADNGRAPLIYVSVAGSHRNRFSPIRGLKVRLADAGLLGSKRIPDEYLLGSIEQRQDLVRGLMDSDGSVTPTSHCTFVNSNESLVDGLRSLLASLGEVASKTWVSDDRSRTGGYWKVHFTPSQFVPFLIGRKAGRVKLRPRQEWISIESIEPVESVPVRCIAVAADDHLFQAGPGCVVTHNTHLYNKPELRRMYKTVTRNLRKRKRIAETWYLETTTMYAAGEESVAEATYKLAQKIAEGTTRSSRLLLDHRWGDIDMSDLADETKLAAALTDAYGDALEWNYLPGMIEEIFDERTDVEDSVRYFLNSQSSAENAWMIPVEWARRKKPERTPTPGEKITLGFDGSRGRMRGVADATALIGCCLDDGHIFEIGVWEQPAGAAGKGWEPPVDIIDSLVDDVFTRYKVVGFYADPAKWESHVANWERKYGQKLLVKSSQRHPIEWWMTGGRGIQTVQALQKFRNAVSQGEMSHDGSGPLTRHILNSRRVQTTSGIQIKKENPDSPNKIDAAVAAVLAFTARLDALAVSPKEDKVAVGYRPRRLL